MTSHRDHSMNNYGYNPRKSPRQQLMRILSSENGERRLKIVSAVKHLALSELNVNEVGHVQDKEIDSIVSKLKQRYPHLYGTEAQDSGKHIFYAYQYILNVHSWKRHREKKKNEKKTKKKVNMKEKKISTMSSGSPSPELASSQNSEAKSNKENIPPSSGPHTLGLTSHTPDPSPNPAEFSQTSTTKTVSSGTNVTSSQTFISTQRSNITGMSDHTSAPDSLSNRCGPSVHPVYAFLDNCIPSMAHHFQGFLAFGCSTAEFLLGMSGWEPERIRHDFLDRLPPNGYTGEHLTEMEKLIIQNQISTYFKS